MSGINSTMGESPVKSLKLIQDPNYLTEIIALHKSFFGSMANLQY